MLEARNIKKNYGKVRVLEDLSFSVRPGECVGIVGANGAGKSTLLEIAAGGITPDAGELAWQGNVLSRKELAELTGFVPQGNPLFEELTVKDNLEMWYRGRRDVLERDMEEGVPAVFGIPDFYRRKVSRLSGGMKRRLSIVCALADRPEILILDEPGAALDLEAKSVIIDYIRAYAGEGHGVLLASHEIPELAACSKLYGMRKGCLEKLKEEVDSAYLRQWIRS